MSSLATLASSLNNFSVSWDLGIIIFVFIAIFLYAFTIGQKKLIYFLLSLYLALEISGMFPYGEKLTENMSEYHKFLARSGILLLTALVIFVLSAGSILRLSFRSGKKESSRLWQKIAVGIASAGLLISSCLALLPQSYYSKLSTITLEFFVLNNSYFWWMLSGVAVLILLRRKKE